MPVLGHISLLGYRGELIHPLCTAGPDESAFGDPLEVSMAEWAQRCLDQGGLVVMPHAPEPQLERAADIVLGLVDAIELMHFNPLDPQLKEFGAHSALTGSPTGTATSTSATTYPLVAGTDKMCGRRAPRRHPHLRPPRRARVHLRQLDGGRPPRQHLRHRRAPHRDRKSKGAEPGGRLDLPAGGGTLKSSGASSHCPSRSAPSRSSRAASIEDEVTVGGKLAAEGNSRLRSPTPPGSPFASAAATTTGPTTLPPIRVPFRCWSTA